MFNAQRLLHDSASFTPAGNVTVRSVRLLGGDDSREGIVEIAYNGRWGMLCDDGFTDTDAQSVCLGLGFGRNDAMMMSLSSSRYKSLVFAKFC